MLFGQHSSSLKILEGLELKEENRILNEEADNNSVTSDKRNKKAFEESKQDYIHVRARRGQATDSHSLAERVRPALLFYFTCCLVSVCDTMDMDVCMPKWLPLN